MKFFDFKEGRLIPLPGDYEDHWEVIKVIRNTEWPLGEQEMRDISRQIDKLRAGAAQSPTGLPEWFALDVDSILVSCGFHESGPDAQDAAPKNTHWVFDEEALRSFQLEIENKLGVAA